MPSTEIKTEDNLETKVLVVPDSAISSLKSEGAKVLKLRHPRHVVCTVSQGSCLSSQSSYYLIGLHSYTFLCMVSNFASL